MRSKPETESVHYTCPVELTLEMVGGKWKPLILWELRGGARRFNALQAALPGVTHKVLAQQLRALERNGFVARTVLDGRAPHVE